MPVDLAHQECQSKRKALEKLRDEKAERLGALVNMRDQLSASLNQRDSRGLANFTYAYRHSMSDASVTPPLGDSDETVLANLRAIMANGSVSTTSLVIDSNLQRPSTLTLLWPRLLIIPPVAFYIMRTIYTSRADLAEFAKDTGDTISRFFQDWLLEPLKGVIKTIRAGGEDGVIVRPEGVAADIDVSRYTAVF